MCEHDIIMKCNNADLTSTWHETKHDVSWDVSKRKIAKMQPVCQTLPTCIWEHPRFQSLQPFYFKHIEYIINDKDKKIEKIKMRLIGMTSCAEFDIDI